MLDNLPVTGKMVPRPVWARHLRRQGGYVLCAPTEEELHDAIVVLADESLQEEHPDLYLEAFRIFDRASR